MLGEIKRESSKILVEEHKNILKIVEALESECERLEQGKEIDENFFKSVIDFIRNYADKFHHAKEEEILFEEFDKKVGQEPDCVHCNPVPQMLFEHDEGRKAVKLMEEALNNGNKNELVTHSRAYISLIREHIFKEDNILYPLTEQTLTEEQEKEILSKFKEVAEKYKEKEKIFIELVKKLSRTNDE